LNEAPGADGLRRPGDRGGHVAAQPVVLVPGSGSCHAVGGRDVRQEVDDDVRTGERAPQGGLLEDVGFDGAGAEAGAGSSGRLGNQLGNPVVTAATGMIPEAVPTISRFFGITITMYFDDHEPAHFHARHASGGGKVRIDTLEVIDSSLGRRQLRLVLAWAELHQHELAENWRRARLGETLAPIEPLR